jgi:hypothetical protein
VFAVWVTHTKSVLELTLAYHFAPLVVV